MAAAASFELACIMFALKVQIFTLPSSAGYNSNMLTDFAILSEDQLLYIPYKAGAGSGSPNIGFIDLKAQPERISEIPELHDFPELAEFIRYLNRPESAFRTLRADSALNHIRRPGLPRSCFSHVSITLEAATPTDDEYYQQLYNSFREYAAHSSVGDEVMVKFMLVPIEVPTAKFRGWCLDVWLYGFGGTDKWARRRWVAGLNVVREFFMRVDRQIRQTNQLSDLLNQLRSS